MACLNLTNGAFTLVQFTTANANVGSVTITRTANSISVAHASFANALFLNGIWESVVFNNGNFVALLHFDSPGGSAVRSVHIVDFTVSGSTPGLVEIHNQGLQLSSVPRPQLELSPGSQSLVFTFSSTGQPNEVQRLNISRSDNGGLVLPGPLLVTGLNGNIAASITATELVIDHPNTNFNDQTTGPRPAGICKVVNPNPDFGEAVLGASNAALATTTQTVTLRNDGLDCLTINSIANNAPYSLTAASAALLPFTLDPNETLIISILFAPAAPSNSINRTLTITRTPANGDSQINCKGKARAAIASIATSSNTLAFGTVPIPPGTGTKTYTVTNNGEIDLSISIAAAPGASDFAWVPIPVGAPLALAAGATTAARTVTFTTTTDGPSANQTITVTPSAGTAKTITCTGAGCIPNAAITAPALTPLAFGQIERGFRTVRFIEITNTGDDDLTFRARITPGAVAGQEVNFGLVLPDNDITDAPSTRNYSVLPTVRCGAGPTGNNVMAVAVSFLADGANGAFAANLVIDNHNATNFPAAHSWTFPLNAEIIDPVPVDIALVIDRSGSMNDPAWSRNKMEAAIEGGRLLVQMLRDTADDRCAIIGFSDLPVPHHHIALVSTDRAALLGTLASPPFTPGGATNIAGGMIFGADELAQPHPNAPPVLKKAMVVLTDGMENRCLQIAGAGPWFSITGRDPPAEMFRPDGITPQDTDPLATPAGVKVYAIGLGEAGHIDSGALTTIAVTTGGSYQGAEDLTGKNFFLLEKYFTQIFMETAGLAQIADPFYDISPGEKHPHQFDILPGDVNAMVVLYDQPGERLPFYIESPKGEILSGGSLPPGFSIRYRSTPTARFAEFFFPPKEPDRYVGLWTVWVMHNGYTCAGEIGGKERGKDVGDGFLPPKCRKSGATVQYGIAIGAGSNLTMQPYVDPGVKYVGDPIRLNAEVGEAGLPVKGATVRVEVISPNGQNYTVPLIDDGAHQDGTADDGDYGGTFVQTYVAGNYQLTFTADGMQGNKPFHRSAHRTKAVLDPRTTGGDGGGGGGDECCRRMIKILRRQERLLEALLKSRR